MRVTLEITSPGGAVSTVVVEGRVELGRAGTDVVLDDPSVSRRHAAVEIAGHRVVVSDLGSSNGTRLNGTIITGDVAVEDGAVLTFGDSRVLIRIGLSAGEPPAAAVVVRPAAAVPTLTTISRDLVEVRFLPGTAGADAAPSVLDTARRARKALAGIGSEAWGTPVGINLVDPFVDPSDPDRVVSTGTVLDTATGNVWMAVTPEARPEDPHRPLALLFGAALPAADDVAYLLEGYGLHLAGAAEPAPATVESLPGPVADLEPNLRTAVAGSYVRYLIAREGEPTFRQLLAAPAGRLAEMFSRLYGMSSTAMEMRWRGERSVEKSTADTRQFLKLSWKYLRPYRLMQAEVFVYAL
jgi:pSer/pThr/pTyr-binding forkhead associated (FHA) protein